MAIKGGDRFAPATYDRVWGTQVTLLKRDDNGSIIDIQTVAGLRYDCSYKMAIDSALGAAVRLFPSHQVFSVEAVGRTNR